MSSSILVVDDAAFMVAEFENGNLDYTPISLYDAFWIAYDKKLGPSLRVEPSPSVSYYGFNTTKPPFDNVHVRRAFRLGIDWRRMVGLLGNQVRSRQPRPFAGAPRRRRRGQDDKPGEPCGRAAVAATLVQRGILSPPRTQPSDPT